MLNGFLSRRGGRARRGVNRTPVVLESLEARINLSAAPVLPAVGATRVTNAAAIGVDSYSAISNEKMEWLPGQSSPDIGYISTNGAYVEYALNAAAAGTYTLSFGMASWNGSDVLVSINGAKQAEISGAGSGAWTNFSMVSTKITLAAGANALRFTSQNSTQYNIDNLSVSLAAAASSPVTNVSDNTAVVVSSYSAISNSKLEYQNGKPDIGYVSTAGATIDYSLNVATAGNYTLTTGAGSFYAASYDVLVNGTKVATFNTPASYTWQASLAQSQTIYLSAGVQTLRFASTPGTQYDLFSISLARQAYPGISPVIAAPASSYPTTAAPDVTVLQRWMTSFTELDITGSTGNDNILVTQSGNTLTINANGHVRQVSGTFGDVAIFSNGGNDTITVDGSVTVDTRVYGGGGADTLTDKTQGKATIVSLGGGGDFVVGNGVNTSYWVDGADGVNASAAERAAGCLHVVASFYGGVSTQLAGQNLADPASDGAGWTRLTANSFWGRGPQADDINQGQASDCYLLAPLSSLARVQPDRLRELAVDLGDGTYAVQFQRNGVTSYVRVDGDLPTSPWGGLYYDHPGSTGDLWASIIEKAYAEFRTGANAYASLNSGWMTAVYNDLGIAANTFAFPTDQGSFYNTVAAALAANKPVDIGTGYGVPAGTPLVASHSYSVVAVARDSFGTVYVTLRNPWGFDGFNVDSNPYDGWVTISYATLQGAASSGTMVL